MERFATNAGDVLVGTSHRKNALSNRPILVGADLLIDAGHTVQIHHVPKMDSSVSVFAQL